LPDGLFLNQKLLFGYILEALGKDNVGIFCGHLEYFTTIYVLHMFRGRLVYFVVIWLILPVLVSCPKKNLATLVPLS
jgi:hypothetical protein